MTLTLPGSPCYAGAGESPACDLDLISTYWQTSSALARINMGLRIDRGFPGFFRDVKDPLCDEWFSLS